MWVERNMLVGVFFPMKQNSRGCGGIAICRFRAIFFNLKACTSVCYLILGMVLTLVHWPGPITHVMSTKHFDVGWGSLSLSCLPESENLPWYSCSPLCMHAPVTVLVTWWGSCPFAFRSIHQTLVCLPYASRLDTIHPVSKHSINVCWVNKWTNNLWNEGHKIALWKLNYDISTS